jgi:hypothetical protein
VFSRFAAGWTCPENVAAPTGVLRSIADKTHRMGCDQKARVEQSPYQDANCFRHGSLAFEFVSLKRLSRTLRMPVNSLILDGILAHPARFERAAFAFGGNTSVFPIHTIEHAMAR